MAIRFKDEYTMNDIQLFSLKLNDIIRIVWWSLLLGYSGAALAKYPNPSGLAEPKKYAPIESSAAQYPAVSESGSFNPPKNPSFLSHYLNRCRPCRHNGRS